MLEKTQQGPEDVLITMFTEDLVLCQNLRYKHFMIPQLSLGRNYASEKLRNDVDKVTSPNHLVFDHMPGTENSV